MPTMTILTGGVDVTALTEDNIRSVYVFQLPFRLRVGSLYRFRHSKRVDLAFRNIVDAPRGCDSGALLMHPMVCPGMGEGARRANLHTRAMALVKKKGLPKEAIAKLAENLTDGGKPFEVPDNDDDKVAIKAIDDFVMGYQIATGDVYGDQPITRLEFWDLIDDLELSGLYISPPGFLVSEYNALQFFNEKQEKIFFKLGPGSRGPLDDHPPEVLAELPKAMELRRDFIFFEFAVEAKRRMARNDVLTALLYAVIALEGAHAAFLRLAVADLFTATADEDARAKLIDAYVDDVLKASGVYKTNQLTPTLFMAEHERPSAADMAGCETGIQMRNEIMHSKVKKGQYVIRNRSTQDFRQAYEAVLRVYDRYVAATKARTPQAEQQA